MEIFIFDDTTRSANLYPLTLTRPSFDLKLGGSTILEWIVKTLKIDRYSLVVPEHLVQTVRLRHGGVRVSPTAAEEDALFINGLLMPNFEDAYKFLSKQGDFVVTCGDSLAFARLKASAADRVLHGKRINLQGITSAGGRGFDSYTIDPQYLLRYPWQLIDLNAPMLLQALNERVVEGEGVRPKFRGTVKGPASRLLMGDGVAIEDQTFFDVTEGPIFVGEGSEIQSFSRISGPTFIGRRVVIRSALIRGETSIGDECRIGGEVDSSIIAGYSNKAHSGFLGHSYVGEWVNIGADACNSDLKNTYGTVRMDIGGKRVDSGSMKVGCFIGDNAKISIGAYIYTGRRIGVASHAYGYVTEDVPSFTSYAEHVGGHLTEIPLQSAVETQRRMMERRGVIQTPEDRSLLEHLFKATQGERDRWGVRKGHLASDR